MDKPAKTARKLTDKLILIALAILIVAPFAIYWRISQQPPDVAKSADDLHKYSADETLLITQGLGDVDLPALDRFDQLEELELHYTTMTDAGMPHVASRKTLKRLVLVSLNLTNDGIGQLGALTNLESLILAGTEGVGTEGLKFLPKLTKLQTLELQQCAGADDGTIDLLLQCPALTRLRLQSLRSLTDHGASKLAEMKGLTWLVLDFCVHITDAGVESLQALTNLETLSLHGLDEMTDAALPAIGTLKALKELNLPVKARFSEAALAKLHAELPGCKINR